MIALNDTPLDYEVVVSTKQTHFSEVYLNAVNSQLYHVTNKQALSQLTKHFDVTTKFKSFLQSTVRL